MDGLITDIVESCLLLEQDAEEREEAEDECIVCAGEDFEDFLIDQEIDRLIDEEPEKYNKLLTEDDPEIDCIEKELDMSDLNSELDSIDIEDLNNVLIGGNFNENE